MARILLSRASDRELCFRQKPALGLTVMALESLPKTTCSTEPNASLRTYMAMSEGAAVPHRDVSEMR